MKVCLLVGAGFSIEANRYVDSNDLPHARPYPLVSELASECFDSSYDLSRGVEAAFQDAIDRRDRAPIGALAKRIQIRDTNITCVVFREGDIRWIQNNTSTNARRVFE